MVKALAVIFCPINLGGDLTIYNGSKINRTDGKDFTFHLSDFDFEYKKRQYRTLIMTRIKVCIWR